MHKREILFFIALSAIIHIIPITYIFYLEKLNTEKPFGAEIVTVAIIGEESAAASASSSPIPLKEHSRSRVIPAKLAPADSKQGAGIQSNQIPWIPVFTGMTNSFAIPGLESGSKILTQIRLKIEHAKYYPAIAKRQNLEGRPEVAFKLNEDGSIALIKITQSSGIQMLDDAAMETIKKASPFPYYEGEIKLTVRYSIE
ncbi:MAG: energy transducer TonB [Deltaproteobacteria bacterium]|nr:energy transducer TonB [Deltaproteobacteria bacterium]MBI2342337.1 energy transducer TonB [Deltaproteobacteria bacterium]MBI2974803.1 energy transducer TonB [Deltaproteobacteria bacterium]